MKTTILNLVAVALGVACVVIGGLMETNGAVVIGAGTYLLGYATKRLGDLKVDP